MSTPTHCAHCHPLLRKLQCCASDDTLMDMVMVAASFSLYGLALVHLLKSYFHPTLSNKFLSLLLLSQVAVCNLLKQMLAQLRPSLSCDAH